MTNSVTEFENLGNSFSEARRSGMNARWERKKQRSTDKTAVGSDRFIPNRSKMNMELARHQLQSSNANESVSTTKGGDDDTYKTALSSALLGDGQSRVLAFGEKAPEPKGDTINNLNVLYSGSMNAVERKKNGGANLVARHIPSAPARILDAPDMLDDYYLNLLSWGNNNVLAVALNKTVYLWNATNGDIAELCSLDGEGPVDSHIASVSWVQEGGCYIAVGTSCGKTQLWDVEAQRKLRCMDGHTDRIGALAWNDHILTSGGRDSLVVNHDVRVAQHNIATLSGHIQEVCQLAWSKDGKTLASGANDNKLYLWDASASSSSSPRFELHDHQAAVKALAWSPHERNLLASGGGTADRTIKFWNSQTGALLNSIDTESQVCSLLWNPYEKEILSSHGYARNNLSLWKYPSMAKIKDLEGHTSRVLHMALSPNGGTVVSAAADETLRFWDVFAPPSKQKKQQPWAGSGTASSNAIPLSADFMRPLQIR